MLLCLLAERLTRGNHRVVVLAHRLGREVGVHARTVPVTLDGLRIECRRDVVVLGNAIEEPTGEPDRIADLDRVDRADLELPLADHDFCVRSRNRQSGFDTGNGVVLDDIAAPDLVGTDTAVVTTLWGWETADRPPVRASVLEEGVLLLHTEPWLLVRILLERGDGGGPRVGFVDGHVRVEHLTEHEHVVASANGIGDDFDRAQYAVGRITGRLLGRRPIESPDGQLLPIGHDLRLGPQFRRRFLAINPDVLRSVGHRSSLSEWSRTHGNLLVSTVGGMVMPSRFTGVTRV